MKRKFESIDESSFVSLPAEIFWIISRHLDATDRFHLMITCSQIYQVMRADTKRWVEYYTKYGIFERATALLEERLYDRYGLDFIPRILRENNAVIAGGFPLQFLTNRSFLDGDIDIFCDTSNYEAIDAEFQRIDGMVEDISEITHLSINMRRQDQMFRPLLAMMREDRNEYPFWVRSWVWKKKVKIQVIRVENDSLMNHIAEFDFCNCRVIYDGNRVYAMGDTQKINKDILILNPFSKDYRGRVQLSREGPYLPFSYNTHLSPFSLYTDDDGFNPEYLCDMYDTVIGVIPNDRINHIRLRHHKYKTRGFTKYEKTKCMYYYDYE